MSDQRVIGGAEIDKPIPFCSSEQHRHSMESRGEHGGATVSDQISLLDNPDIPELGEDGIGGDEAGDLLVVVGGGGGVEVDEVVVGRVVEGEHEALQLHGVAGGGGDEVGEGGVVGVALWGDEGACWLQDGDGVCALCGDVEEREEEEGGEDEREGEELHVHFNWMVYVIDGILI